MQIQINLHPQRGTRRGPRALPMPSIALGRTFAPLRDKYLVGAVAAVVLSCGGIAALHVTQQRELAELKTQEDAAVRDSARFATVIAARTKALARRDSLARELRVIAAIDSTRYVWAHVLDEVSRSLPPYTWLTNVTQTSAPPAPPLTVAKAAAAKGAAPAEGKGAPAKAAVDSAPTAMKFRVVGQTVDIQALTQFMRDLEASPFVRNVQLAKSEPVTNAAPNAGREVTEFTLDAEFEQAPREVLRTVSVSVQVR